MTFDLDLCYHKSAFDIEAEWYFFATSHGKGPCDGVGGAVKRLATMASIRRVNAEQIVTPYQFYEFSKQASKHIHFDYCDYTDYNATKTLTLDKFNDSKMIAETHKMHAIIPQSDLSVHAKYISCSQAYKKRSVSVSGKRIL